MDNKKEIIIIGSGFIGNSLFFYLKKKFSNVSLLSTSNKEHCINYNQLKKKKLRKSGYLIYCSGPSEYQCSMNFFQNLKKHLEKLKFYLKFSAENNFTFIYNSTYKVYDFENNKISLNSRISIDNEYKSLHFLSEKFALEYKKGLVLRLPNIFSTNINDNYFNKNILVNSIILHAKKNLEFKIKSKKDFKRNILNIQDYKLFIYRILKQKRNKRVMNVFSNKSYYLVELVEKIYKKYNSNFKKINNKKLYKKIFYYKNIKFDNDYFIDTSI